MTIVTSLHDLLERSAHAHSDAAALTYRDRTVSYAELWREVRVVAAHLAELGVRRGDRVAIYLEKRIETVVATFAASARRGGVRSRQSRSQAGAGQSHPDRQRGDGAHQFGR